MNIKITFRSMDHSDAIERYVREKIEKLYKFFKRENSDSIFISFTLEGHRTHHYFIAELKVKSAQYDLIAKKEGPEMYVMIDNVVNIMDKEISREKEKHVSSMKHGAMVRE